jgi:hypothetical protein
MKVQSFTEARNLPPEGHCLNSFPLVSSKSECCSRCLIYVLCADISVFLTVLNHLKEIFLSSLVKFKVAYTASDDFTWGLETQLRWLNTENVT